ncbi:unnamed protein product, partial [Iphiclides podalirius]
MPLPRRSSGARGGRSPDTAYFVRYRRRPPRVPLHLRARAAETPAQGEKTPFKSPWSPRFARWQPSVLALGRPSHAAVVTAAAYDNGAMAKIK